MIEVTTVHILSRGRPLCGFMPGCVPGQWPERHKWVAIDSTDETDLKAINCKGCKMVKGIHQDKQELGEIPPETTASMSDERRAELKMMLKHMGATSDFFYSCATRIGCHPFIEFTGFMNEYLKICEKALERGIDFAEANEHSGIPLPIEDYEGSYLGEKFGCIFGPTMRANPEAWKAFQRRFLEG